MCTQTTTTTAAGLTSINYKMRIFTALTESTWADAAPRSLSRLSSTAWLACAAAPALPLWRVAVVYAVRQLTTRRTSRPNNHKVICIKSTQLEFGVASSLERMNRFVLRKLIVLPKHKTVFFSSFHVLISLNWFDVVCLFRLYVIAFWAFCSCFFTFIYYFDAITIS